MKSLQEIKDQVAQANGYQSWESLIRVTNIARQRVLLDEVARKYAKAYAEADRKDCAEKALIQDEENGVVLTYPQFESDTGLITVNKSSILDRPYPEMK